MEGVGKNREYSDFRVELLVVFAILISLGFPGSFTKVFGNTLGTVLEYGAFFIEIFAMLLSSGSNWLEIRVIDLDRRYATMYLFMAVIFTESMLVTRYPSEELISCVRLGVTLFFAIWLQEQFGFARVVELFGIAQALFVLFSLVFIVLYPAYAYESGDTFTHALKGLYFTKNSFASELSFGVLIISCLIKEKRRRGENCKGWLTVLGVQFVMLLMCQSTGQLLCTLVALVPLFLPGRIRLPLGWGYIAGNLAFLFGTLTLMPYFDWFFEAIGKDASLTGRIPLWHRIIEVMMGNRTLTGFGYAMFWRDPKAYGMIHQGFDRWSSLSKITSGAHNVLLELWLNIGLIGIGCFFLMIVFAMRHLREISDEKYCFCSAVMVHLLINGLTERCLGGTYEYKTMILFFVLAICSNWQRELGIPAENRLGSEDRERGINQGLWNSF